MGRKETNSGRIRIIGGRWRGRRIAVPDVPGLRPTPDRVRETVFNWLASYLDGARVLDLFAGSGVLGLEALSRGAFSLVAVERDRNLGERLREAGRTLGAGQLEVVVSDTVSFLKGGRGGPYDLVFLDPPHAATDYTDLCGRLEASGLLSPNALLYVEQSAHRSDGFEPPATWQCHRSGRAGDVAYQLWRRLSSPPD